MKNKDPKNTSRNQQQLFKVFTALDTPELAKAFLTDLCSPSELEAMMDRWAVAPLLEQGLSYRDIYAKTGVSLTTIGRVARSMQLGQGGYKRLLKKLKLTRH